MVRCNQAVEIHCAQLNLIAYRFTQPRTTRVKSLGNHLHWKGAKKLLVGHRGNSKLLLHTNHAHPHGATKIERFTASEDEPNSPPPAWARRSRTCAGIRPLAPSTRQGASHCR